ncbi:MAG: hypothetical protein U9R56_07525 [candidate division Zixibacteria bacterium]|nr:hypothetical protein [candidate division Zixibacteria bacterium]
MKITGFMIHRFSLPLKRPLFFGSENPEMRAGVIIELRNDSEHIAYGEASPLPGFSKEDIATVENELLSLGRSLTGCTVPVDLDKLSGGFEHWLSKYDLSPSSRCGVETATLQLMAAERGVPMNRIISYSPRDSVTVNGLLSNQPRVEKHNVVLFKTAGITSDFLVR